MPKGSKEYEEERKKNNQAARKCRARKRLQMCDLQMQVEELKTENERLKDEVTFLRQKLKESTVIVKIEPS